MAGTAIQHDSLLETHIANKIKCKVSCSSLRPITLVQNCQACKKCKVSCSRLRPKNQAPNTADNSFDSKNASERITKLRSTSSSTSIASKWHNWKESKLELTATLGAHGVRTNQCADSITEIAWERTNQCAQQQFTCLAFVIMVSSDKTCAATKREHMRRKHPILQQVLTETPQRDMNKTTC